MRKKISFLFLTLMTVFTSYSQVSKDTVKVINLSDVQVTGIRPGVNTPISQKTITSLDISKNYHGQEMTYILEKTPSITTQSDGGQPNGYTYFRIRGIDQTRINVTLNGSPLNESEDQGCYYSNYPGFATYLKSVQVQRGVGTSSNGTSSYGGSINFESKDGLYKSGDITLSNGSFNTNMLNISVGSGLLKNKTAFFGGFSTYNSDGYRKHSGGMGTSGFLSIGYYGNRDVIKITTFTGISYNRMAWLPTPESDILLDRTTNILSDKEVDNFNQSMIQLQSTHSFNKKSILTSTLFYNNLNGVYGVMLPNSVLNDPNYYNVPIDITKDNDLFNYKLKSNFFGGTVNYKLTLNNFDINTGINLNIYNRKHIGITNYDTATFKVKNIISYENIGYKNEMSGYIKTKYTKNKLIFFGDIQVRKPIFNYKQIKNYSYNIPVHILSVNWGTFINPMGGITYKLSNKEKIYTSIGLTHREPTRIDMFGDDNYYGLNSIKIESVVDYELGYNLNNSKLNINVNLYYMYFNNQYIPYGKLNSIGLMVMTSVDKSYRMGIEFDGKYKISDNLSTSNNTTLSNNKILSNGLSNMLYTPSVIINQDVEYTINKLYFNLSVRYLSKSQIDLTNKDAICPEYTTLNSKIGYHNKFVDLSLSCLNLTNTKYYTFGNVSDDGTKNYFVGSPISFYTTVKVNF